VARKQRKTPLALTGGVVLASNLSPHKEVYFEMKLKIKTKVFELAFEMNVVQLVAAILMFFS
jgi:hypothetical protein